MRATKFVDVPGLDINVDVHSFRDLIRAQPKERHHDDRYPSAHRRDCEGDERFAIPSLRIDGKEGVVVESSGVYRLHLKLPDGGNAEVVEATLFDGCPFVGGDIFVVGMMMIPQIILWIVGMNGWDGCADWRSGGCGTVGLDLAALFSFDVDVAVVAQLVVVVAVRWIVRTAGRKNKALRGGRRCGRQ